MRKFLLLTAVALLGAMALATSASARSGDRNHDRIPDRWERAHHLSLKVNEARRDQDKDGLKNLGEFRAGTDPRKADSDGDGTPDVKEHAGTIASFTGGVLTITLAQGGELSATVDSATKIECGGSADAHSSSHGSDDSASGTGTAGDDPATDDQSDDSGTNPATHDAGDDDGTDDAGTDDQGHDEGQACGTAALTTGATVDEADLQATSDGKRFVKLELGS